jgi:hypothetical protein
MVLLVLVLLLVLCLFLLDICVQNLNVGLRDNKTSFRRKTFALGVRLVRYIWIRRRGGRCIRRGIGAIEDGAQDSRCWDLSSQEG